MPMLSPQEQDNYELSLGARGDIPDDPKAVGPQPGLLGAALRRGNLFGTLYERLENPKPQAPAVPDYDPISDVPKGYEHVAQIFEHAQSPAEVEWTRQQYDREQRDAAIIGSHHGWGTASVMAAGLTDPVTVASMAIPVGGEARLASALRTAVVTGAASAAQLKIQQQLEVSPHSLKSDALNVAGSAIVGGVLGGLLHARIPDAERAKLYAGVEAEVHGDAPTEAVMGPIDGRQRLMPEVEMPPEMRDVPPMATPEERAAEPQQAGQGLKEYESAAAAAERRASPPATQIEPLPERNTKTPDVTQDSILQYLAKHNAGLSSEEAAAQGIDKASFMDAAARVGIKRAFRKNGMTFDEAAEHLHEAGFPVADESGAYSPNVLLDRIDDELRGTPSFSERNTYQTLESAHQELQDRAMQSKLDEHPPLSDEYQQMAPEERQFVALADQARTYDREAAERVLESQRPDADIARDLQRIVRDGHANAAAELESSESARLLEAARQSAGVETPDGGLTDAPTAVGELSNIPINPTESQSFGAAAAQTPDMRGNTIAKGAVWADKLFGFVSPASRVGRSPSLAARQVLQEIVNLPGTLAKNWDRVVTRSPIERNLWLNEGLHYQGIQARQAAWKQLRQRIKTEGGEQMSYGQFGQEVSKAMRRNDAHTLPEVAQAAKDTRRIVFEPLKQRAITAGLLPADVKPEFADSYLMRQYDFLKIRDNHSTWIKLVSDHFRGQGVDAAEALDLAHQVTRNVMGSERGTMDWKMMEGITPKSGRFKERTLSLPDVALEPYLNSNIEQLSHSYLRSMAPEVEFTERFGSRDMKGQIADIYDDYARLIERAGTDKEKSALTQRMSADIRDLTAMRDRLYGIYGQPKDPSSAFVRTGRLLRTVNAGRLLGAATLAHFPDIANVMMRYGIPNTLAAMGKILTSGEAMNLTRSQAKRLGVGLDFSMSTLAGQLGDFASHSNFAEQRIAQRLIGRYTTFTGETPLISMVQQLTSTMAQDEIIRAAQKVSSGGELPKALAANMAAAGLDTDVLKGIATQHEKFGARVNGLAFGMSEKWADQALARIFESAVAREGHGVTLRPGAGDTPLFMSTEWGKTLRQFTTFGYAASRTVVNPILQGLAHGDPRAVQAVMALAGAGSLSYVSKQIAAGQPIEDPTSGKFALEVLDKSNLLGWTSSYIFPALWLAGADKLSRWSDQDAVETIGGPTAGTLAAIYKQRLPAKVFNSFKNDTGINDEDEQEKGVNRADVHFMRRLMPGQNHWLFRNAINYTEDQIADVFDLPGKSNADRAAERALP